MGFAIRFLIFALPLLTVVITAPERWRKYNRAFFAGTFAYAALVFGVL